MDKRRDKQAKRNKRRKRTDKMPFPRHPQWMVTMLYAMKTLLIIAHFPLDFIAKLVALVPKPRVNLTRFHGVFAPNSTHRVQVTPAKRGKGNKVKVPNESPDLTPAERRASMTWAQRLKRVFKIDIETCRECGGTVKVIACIEDPVVIEKILTHLNVKAASAGTGLLPASRAPP